MGDYVGLIELFGTAAIVLGFLGYQYWSVRDAGTKPTDGDDSAASEGSDPDPK